MTRVRIPAVAYFFLNLNFNILKKLVITDHRALSIEFLEDKKRKLDRVKEIIEPYNIANNKIDDISNKLIDVFKSEVPEVKLLRLLHDNKFNFIVFLSNPFNSFFNLSLNSFIISHSFIT